jgi:hypothetical protein
MSGATIAIVVAGFVAVGFAAVTSGVDVTAIVILALIGVLGGLAVSVARKSRSGAVKPATCGACGGLNSPNAPYCKHCGAPLRT